MKHPSNKFQRKLIEEKRNRFVNSKKGTLKAQRPAKIYRKLSIESLKEQEAEQELQHASYREDDQSSVVD